MRTTELTLSGADGHRIPPLLFGSFVEHIENCIQGGIYDPDSAFSDAEGIRADVLEKCRELGPAILRFPGGTVMGIYHWEDHVGPVAARKKMRNIVWGGMLCHGFGTAEFVRYCRAIGAEPMICVNMPTGTAEEAANWVEYCNGTGDSYYANLRRSHGHAQPFNVKYWCIGNESYAVPDLGIQHDVNVYIRDAWEFTKYMKMTDPSIRLVYVGYDEAWNRAVLDSLGAVCDYLSIHFYASTGTDENQAFDMTQRFREDTLTCVFSLLDEYNSKPVCLDRWYRIPPRSGDIRVALDEWNIWNAGDTDRSRYGLIQSYTWLDALWTGEFLNLLIVNGDHIGIANLAQMVNVIAPIMAQKDGSYRQTTFYPFSMFARYAGEVFVPSTCEGLNVSVSRTGESLRVLAVNRSDEAVALALPFECARMLCAVCDDKDRVNTLESDCVAYTDTEPNTARVVIPPYGVCVLLSRQC